MSETTPRRVHFVAIGGTGMGSLAGLLRARGVHVTGSDQKLYPPMSTALADWGIPVYEGFRSEHLIDAAPDLVVIGNAVRPDNPEARTALEEGFAYRSFPDALYELAIAGRHPVVVAGTHGKTTTTSLLAFLLRDAGRAPSFLVGGYALDFDGSFAEGGGEHFVVEGDEYDTAFFDKTPKFLHYHPRTLMITSVEFDHADIYRDLDHVKEAFRSVVAGMPASGTIVAATDHENVRDVLRDAPCPVAGYGFGEDADWRAAAPDARPDGTHFEVRRDGAPPLRARVPLYGSANLENALGALATVCSLGVSPEAGVAGLSRFGGVKRRQELRGEVAGVAVVDDFAHHPTAVAATLEAMRARFPGRRIVALFEPRTNTSRRAVFQRDYAGAFDAADRVIVRRVPDAPLYSATGEVRERLSADRLASDLCERGVPAAVEEDVEAIVARVASESARGDVVVTLSNGSFDGVWEKLLAALEERT